MGSNNCLSNIISSLRTSQVLKKVFLIALLCLTLTCLFEHVVPREKFKVHTQFSDDDFMYHVIDRFFEKRQCWLTSNLGVTLFKNQPLKFRQQNKTFTVLIWKHPWWTQSYIRDHHQMCSVKNCMFTDNDDLIRKVDAVVISMYTAKYPWVYRRSSSQRWVFLSNESPMNTFGNAKLDFSRTIQSMANVFNWSMTYRSDSDVPTPFVRTVPLPEVLIKIMNSRPTNKIIPYLENKQKEVLAVAIISHCNVSEPMNYLQELQKYIKVDIFGRCAKNKKMKKSCPGNGDCPKIRNYVFYLAFENYRCRQYITEKVFYAFANGAIPIVMGAPVFDYEKLLPPNSFLHVNSYDSPRDLAMEILNLGENKAYLELYHKWRYYFQVVNEHGYFRSEPNDLCRLCEALNYNDDKTKIYDLDTLRLYLDPKLLCS